MDHDVLLTARDTYVDFDKLIDLVEQYESLYDFSHPDHKDIHLSKTIWDTIGWELGSTGHIVKQKWRSKRDSYVRLRREIQASGSNHRVLAKAKKWRYYRRLAFLEPYMDDNSNEHTGTVKTTNAVAANRVASPGNPPSSTPISAAGSSPESSEQSKAMVGTTRPLPVKLTYTPTVMTDGVGVKEEWQDDAQNVNHVMFEAISGQRNVASSTPADDDTRSDQSSQVPDGDDLFMASCLVQLKDLPLRERWEAKMEIMNVLYKKKFQGSTLRLDCEISGGGNVRSHTT